MKRRYKPNLDGLPVGTRIRQAYRGHYRVGIIHETQTEKGGEYRVRPLNSFKHYPVKPKTIVGIEHLPGAPIPPAPWKGSSVQPAPPPPASNDRPEPFYGFSSAEMPRRLSFNDSVEATTITTSRSSWTSSKPARS